MRLTSSLEKKRCFYFSRFVRGLISEFAHFIPHSIDFADSIDDLGVDRYVLLLYHYPKEAPGSGVEHSL